MKVKLLKTGRFAHPRPYLPQVEFVAGNVEEVDNIMGAELIKVGWAEIPSEKKEEIEVKVEKKVIKKKSSKKKKS